MRTYVIQCSETKRVKIGQTKGDPQRRLETLQTGSPTRLILIAELGVAEVIAHFALRDHRTHGEWFTWCDEVSAFIDEAKIENDHIVTIRKGWLDDEAWSCKKCGYDKESQGCPSCNEMARSIQDARGYAHYLWIAYGIGNAA